ncbi:helix-turn-helix domain-containing protein [Phascolarctobacterium faecium]|uniref:helix-turn-helix domain-containing protein n=1 Tax=Phascolarctobacterium faecium TaxID=33025 RepID=UPI00242B28B8|nr:helix-turn-helix transcriptional regulator [Phascolarctobacterium faecium]
MYDESCLPRIGSNIQILRSTCLFKQQQFAERIGISQTHLSNIEHNNVQVSLKLLLRSANVLGCTLETLLDRKAAAEWTPAHDAEADEQAAGEKSERVPETAAAETEEQELYSLEEVRLLLKLLQLSKGR